MAYLLKNLDLGDNEVFNSCGKPVFAISPLEQFKRFLFLGTEKGTYYVSEQNLTELNLNCIEYLLDNSINHCDVIKTISQYVEKSFKRDYLIYALARCCSYYKDSILRKSAYELLPKVCTIPTHLFLFLELYEALCNKYNGSTGWNKLHKKAINDWYINKKPLDLVYHITKYKNRNGWTHRDVLRLAHIKPENQVTNMVFKYITKNELPTIQEYVATTDSSDRPALDYLICADEVLKSTNKEFVISMIKKYKFVREHISSSLQTDVDVMNELAQNMPLVALLRTVNRLTTYGVFTQYPETLDLICSKLGNEDYIRASKVHPLQFLISLKMYASGKGERGSLMWSPESQLSQKLNDAFYSSFVNVTPTNKRYLLALDVSGSMTANSCCGITCLTASEVACAMAMVIKKTEPCCDIMGFSNKFTPLDINPNRSLEKNLEIVYNSTFESTDISLPMNWAISNGKVYDVIIVFTDNETNCNSERPSDVLKRYRNIVSPNCKLIVMALASNGFTIADPSDKGMMDMCGFDASTPSVISEFVNL
jgi:60 kDa SS-A/Ro ribonucleoprotein